MSLEFSNIKDKKQINVFLAYATYLSKALCKFNFSNIIEAFSKNSDTLSTISECFIQRFDINSTIDITKNDVLNKISVSDEQHHNIFVELINVIFATVRVNFFQDSAEDFIALKIDSKVTRQNSILQFETVIYSKDMEGIHMRSDLIARGGIRWSSRHNDYPTEVMALVTAQVQKNVVIVPSGAKGCFISRISDTDPAFGLAAYDTFIKGLLSLADNFTNQEKIFAKNVKRLDFIHDPYIVVAADKGTASFSDHANDIAKQSKFWLNDAFASGGSNGYDHKKIGITSLGTLVATKHHFKNLGVDITSGHVSNLTVIGVGGMSGDVFGNAMIFLGNIKLIAAFSHSHIFIDPNPNVYTSLEERKRLFKLNLSWKDYNKSLISTGGGIFEISSSKIDLTQEIRDLLQIDVNSCSGHELVKYILSAHADLLFFGGIGTFVKASDESHTDVKDPSCELMRIDACNLNVKVISEGANLAMTRKSRIEAAKKGIMLNTDAFDNFSGVNCSDHEVNLKIAFADFDVKKRNEIIANLQNDVVSMLLNENERRNIAVFYDLVMSNFSEEMRNKFLKMLEKFNINNRDCTFTRPEICEHMSVIHSSLKKQMLQSGIFNELCQKYSDNYFPETVRNDFHNQIATHLLKVEIGITEFTNLLFAAFGSQFIFELAEKHFSDKFIEDIHDITNKRLDLKSTENTLHTKILAILAMLMHLDINTKILQTSFEFNKDFVMPNPNIIKMHDMRQKIIGICEDMMKCGIDISVLPNSL